ncbi:MAG: hypothetical protein ACKV22_29835 [Bryobacteraceae bacterium]
MNTPRFFAGLDIGKQHDHSALAVLELRTRKAGFDPVYWVPIVEWDLRVRRLTRFPLGTSYRDLVDSVEREMRTPEFGVDTPLVVDATGVGDAIVDLLRGSAIPLVPVILTGGERVAQSGGRLHVPKHQLIDTLCVLLEQGKLAAVRRLPLAHAFLRELNDFEARVSVSGRPSYGAFRDNAHDDLVIAVALAAWYCRYSHPDPGRVRLPPPL